MKVQPLIVPFLIILLCVGAIIGGCIMFTSDPTPAEIPQVVATSKIRISTTYLSLCDTSPDAAIAQLRSDYSDMFLGVEKTQDGISLTVSDPQRIKLRDLAMNKTDKLLHSVTSQDIVTSYTRNTPQTHLELYTSTPLTENQREIAHELFCCYFFEVICDVTPEMYEIDNIAVLVKDSTTKATVYTVSLAEGGVSS